MWDVSIGWAPSRWRTYRQRTAELQAQGKTAWPPIMHCTTAYGTQRPVWDMQFHSAGPRGGMVYELGITAHPPEELPPFLRATMTHPPSPEARFLREMGMTHVADATFRIADPHEYNAFADERLGATMGARWVCGTRALRGKELCRLLQHRRFPCTMAELCGTVSPLHEYMVHFCYPFLPEDFHTLAACMAHPVVLRCLPKTNPHMVGAYVDQLSVQGDEIFFGYGTSWHQSSDLFAQLGEAATIEHPLPAKAFAKTAAQFFTKLARWPRFLRAPLQRVQPVHLRAAPLWNAFATETPSAFGERMLREFAERVMHVTATAAAS